MYTVNNVADFFLSKDANSPKKLQKLVYYAYAWYIALVNEDVNNLSSKLFDSRIEAWIHGPVVPELYHEYKDYGGEDIPQKENFDNNLFSTEALDILEQVWTVYGKYTGNQLEMMTHKEQPWINARGTVATYESSTNLVSDKDMFIYYNEQASK